MSQIINGTLYRSGSSHACAAQLVVTEQHLNIISNGTEHCSYNLTEVQLSDAIPGIATEIRLPNGDMFIPADKNWRLNKQNGSLLSQLESNWLTVVSSIILAPALVYWLIMVAMPALASKSVEWLPESIPAYMGEQSFTIIDEAFLSPSSLDDNTNNSVNSLFDKALKTLHLNNEDYQLLIKESDYFGANALALPNGTVIVTDGLITQLMEFEKKQSTASFDSMLMAIILHEIGHVEAKHSLRLVAQSLSNAIVFALLLGDLETVGELMVGASSAVIQANFSRDMETEADNFALSHLGKLGYESTAFADAMESFNEEKVDTTESIFKYLSSHPAIVERIEKAKNFNSQQE